MKAAVDTVSGTGWQPVPVPPPTYTLKAKAPAPVPVPAPVVVEEPEAEMDELVRAPPRRRRLSTARPACQVGRRLMPAGAGPAPCSEPGWRDVSPSRLGLGAWRT